MVNAVSPDAETIDVVLMRHGEARALAGKDAARPLTQLGVRGGPGCGTQTCEKIPISARCAFEPLFEGASDGGDCLRSAQFTASARVG